MGRFTLIVPLQSGDGSLRRRLRAVLGRRGLERSLQHSCCFKNVAACRRVHLVGEKRADADLMDNT